VSGFLGPNDVIDIHCTFAPNAAAHYTFKVPCYYSHEPMENNFEINSKRSTLTVSAKSIVGSITSSTSLVDFGTILVNNNAERDVTLFNSTECDMFYSLVLHRVDINGAETVVQNDIKSLVHLTLESEVEVLQVSKVLPARSTQFATLRTYIREAKSSNYKLYYVSDSKLV
jgi:hypothetical protein